MPRWNNAKVIDVQDWTKEHRRIFLEVDPNIDLAFVPGQFITFDLPIGEKRLERWRSYSIANQLENNIIELCIVKVPNGRASKYLFEHINIGEELVFKGPSGTFILPQDHSLNLVLICTGTGVAPFRSMINHIFSTQIPFPKIDLIFGTKYKKSILYKEEFDALCSIHDNFNYHVALSREPYLGYQGYVHELYEKLPTIENTLYMLCGWQYMIDEAVQNLTQNQGIDRSKVVYELYG